MIPGQLEAWLEKLPGLAPGSWSVFEKPGAKRALLSVATPNREAAERLRTRLGGRVEFVPGATWISRPAGSPLRIGSALEIVHEAGNGETAPGRLRLQIPLGLAFGGGDHATTSMLLRALARQRGLLRGRVLDLGTGSGILALAARRLGASRIVATDFDPAAIRTARENEALNFATPLISWRRSDVRRLRAPARYDLVLANLFSGVLQAACGPIAAAVTRGGQLWLSGILREQAGEVIAAYRGEKLELLRCARRGKWILLQWRKPMEQARQLAGGSVGSGGSVR